MAIEISNGMAGMFGLHMARGAAEANATKVPVVAEKGRIREADELNLGDLNPLIHSPELGKREPIEALKAVTSAKIEKYGGVEPVRMESTVVTSLNPNIAPQLRFVARFEVGSLTEEQMQNLEALVKASYPIAVRTRKSSDGRDLPTESYPPTQNAEGAKAKTGGWYMGPLTTSTDSLHNGLFVFKDLGEVNKDNFLEDKQVETKYIVEVREAGMYQTDLVEFVTQVSTILAGEAQPNSGDLLYEIYYDLMRLGLKKKEGLTVHGIDDAIVRIKRGLLIPLASRELSRGIGQEPESVLMIGVPGTGKTLTVGELIKDETGVFILPIDPLELVKELLTPKEKQTLLPRIAAVAKKTGKPVVLHIDDIENMIQNSSDTHSTLLNLMAGIKENGFYILASTNEPEKIDPALLQPQRFGVLIHFGLHETEARLEMLRIHAASLSRNMELPLFSSNEERDVILQFFAERTDGFTPRYLAEIANIAKSHFLARIASARETGIGLTEQDLAEEQLVFTPEDWIMGFEEVYASYDKKGTQSRDRQLAEFITRHNPQRQVGYMPNRSNNQDRLAGELYGRLAQIPPEANREDAAKD